MNNKGFLDIKINSKEDFLRTLDILHDASINESEIIYNKSNHTLDILVEREFFEDKNAFEVKRVFLFVKKYIYPIVKSRLYLSNLATFKRESHDTSLKIHRFNECKIKGNIYILEFCEVLRLELSFNGQPFGFFQDLEFVKNKKGSFLRL